MKRGEIRWYTFRLPDKRQPFLVLTRGTPEQVAACEASYTGRFLKKLLAGRDKPGERV